MFKAFENKYCSKCSYPLKPEAYEEIKMEEEKRIKELEAKYFILEDKMEKRFQQIISKIDVSKLK